MQETFTHRWILYTLFDSFVNHILAAIKIDGSSVVRTLCWAAILLPDCGVQGLRTKLVGTGSTRRILLACCTLRLVAIEPGIVRRES
jgi:hypothetical protein